MSGFPDRTTFMLGRAMALRLDRMHLIAGNIANVDTPGYVPVDMKFEKALGREIAAKISTTDGRHFRGIPDQGTEAELFYDPTSMPGLDGNAVSLDREMAKLAENNTKYAATAMALKKKLAMLRYAVSEGGAS